MKLNNLLIPFDAYERNKKIATLLDKGDKVLDVGGGITGIKLFSDNRVTIVDLEVGDIKMDARKLKLKDNSFDVVVSVDVIEHLPREDRKNFVKNLVRIAKRLVVISAPYGGKLHLAAEKRLLSRLKKIGRKDFFLKQHVKYILPKPEDIINKTARRAKVLYSGDFRVNNFLFWLSHYETGKSLFDRPLLVYKSAVNLVLNLFFYPFWFSDDPRPYTNRFYIIYQT